MYVIAHSNHRLTNKIDSTPYCTSLASEDLRSFLEQYGGKYPALTLRVQQDEGKLPCIEVSTEMCQSLIMYAATSQAQKNPMQA